MMTGGKLMRGPLAAFVSAAVFEFVRKERPG